MITRIVNITGAKAAAKAFSEAIRGDVAPPEEIQRRTNICTQCPRYQKKMSATTKVSLLLGRLANKNRVPGKLAKSRCGACKCSLMLLLPSKTPHPDTPEQYALRWEKCWALTPEQQAEKAMHKAKEDKKDSWFAPCEIAP